MTHQTRNILAALILCVVAPINALASGTAQDFIRLQAAKAAFITDVGKIAFMAGEVHRFDTYAVMRMTHTHWHFAEDKVLKDRGNTYAYEVRSTAERNEHDIRRLQIALERNAGVDDAVRQSGSDMVELLDKLIALSFELADIYETGDVTRAGDHYYAKIVPVYEAIRRGETTLATSLARDIKLAALKFKP